MIDLFSQKRIVFTNNPLRIKCSIQNMPKTVLLLLLLILTPWTHGAYRHETPVLSKPIEVIHLSEDLVVLDKPCSLPVSDTHTLLTQFLYFSSTVLPYHENFWATNVTIDIFKTHNVLNLYLPLRWFASKII